MTAEQPKVATFHGEESGVEGILLSVSPSGLCKVMLAEEIKKAAAFVKEELEVQL